jgi:hypothetical protein
MSVTLRVVPTLAWTVRADSRSNTHPAFGRQALFAAVLVVEGRAPLQPSL